MKITAIHSTVVPIASAIRNAYIDFSKMTASVVAVVTDVVRDGKRVVGYGFNSNGRYAQAGLLAERFIPRIMQADPRCARERRRHAISIPHRIWASHDGEREAGRTRRALGRRRRDRHGGVGRRREDRRQAALSPARRPLQRRQGRRQSVRLCGRRLLLSRQEPQGAEGRDAQVSRPRLLGGQAQNRRRIARRRSEAHRRGDRRRRLGRQGRGRCERPLRPRHRGRVREGARALRPVLVRGSRATRSISSSRPSSRATTQARWRPARIFSRCRTRAT